jgi:Raf kinase inhibitor-like YbhB/YbcL family protein
MKKLWLVVIVLGLFHIHCGKAQQNQPDNQKVEGQSMSLVLKTDAFADGETIPVKYTCDGEDVSPKLMWEGVPEGTKSLALICDDPDAPVGLWVHWIIYNIPPEVTQLPENVDKHSAQLGGTLQGARQGVNSWGKIGYGGPCPPKGPAHRYFFKLYALDTVIAGEKLDKKALEKAMEGHILAQAQIMGKYQR